MHLPVSVAAGAGSFHCAARRWLLLAALLVAGSSRASEPAGAAPRFERDIAPLLAAHCMGCHGLHEREAGLDLRSVAGILRGGDSGPAAIAGDAAGSLVIQRIERGEMPPNGAPGPSAEQLAKLAAWIAAGLPADQPDVVWSPPPVTEADRQHWAFRPLAHPPIPPVRHAELVASPIDAFLLARLEAAGLAFSPEAERQTLVRRLWLDVVGLLPPPEEVDAFLADSSPNAYERLVERLLASPGFGERWARRWLDAAGYADTVGFDVDATLVITSEGKWKYRDYVIRSLNADKPFDQFVVEQIAGDELYDWRRAEHLTPEMIDALVATGYLRTARDLTHEGVGVIPQNFYGIVHDTLEIVGTGLLALTLQCARCHDHKFDPLPQVDYYRLMAIFAPAYNPQDWRAVVPYEPQVQDRSVPDVGLAEQAEIERHNREIDARVALLQAEIAAIRGPHEERLRETRLAGLPEPIREDVRTALQTPAAERTAVQQYLADKLGPLLAVGADEVAAALAEQERAAIAALEREIAAANAGKRRWGRIQALYDVGAVPATHVHIRGNYETPGAEVQPGFLSVLDDDGDALANVVPPYAGTSGRRLALARWLTQPERPPAALMARVLVNRVWAALFGRGLVDTPDNFGRQGELPSHPELLEWLASDFIEQGWRLKHLLRTLLVSRAYRQEAIVRAGREPDPATVDPANRLLWRMPLRRLEAEAVRDCLLAASGRLNPAMGGPPVMTAAQPDGSVVVARDKLADPRDEFRRSIYLLTRRAYNLSLLTVFDQPQIATNCVARTASAVPLQSLTMLNDAFVCSRSEGVAERVEACAAEPAGQIAAAFRFILCRLPNADEQGWCARFLEEQAALYQASGAAPQAARHEALVQLCHALFNSSEFLYIE
ncbi:MAG: PSD1 and planctomycete cytochrome C domain-containing protein [Pirellulales bacterium]|nr:PSD1 and planctomycete cytochrome C domain-containing protein [Pirellulales bacterium]